MEPKEIEIEFKGKKIRVREVEIEYKGKKEKVVYRRLGFAEKNSFMSRFMQMQVVGSTTRGNMQPFEMRTGAVQECIVKAPFQLDAESLNDPDLVDILEELYRLIETYNKLGEAQKKKLDKSSQ